MFGKSVKSLEFLKRCVTLSGHLCMVLQIVVLSLVFICALYIVFGVFEKSSLEFLAPLMDNIKSFVVSILGDSIKESQDGIDGRLVAFILAGALITFFIVQLRMACNTYSKVVDKKIVEAREEEEKKFNLELEDDMHKGLLRQSNYLLAIQIQVKSLYKESLTHESHSAEEIYNYKMESIEKFYSQIKTLNGVDISRDEDVILINSKNINNIDTIISAVWHVSDQLKAEYRTKKIGFRAKVAVDSYSPYKKFEWVYKQIRPLLGLNANNEVLCFGNFRNRYNLLENCQYTVCIKGQYELNAGSDETVWSIVKKS